VDIKLIAYQRLETKDQKKYLKKYESRNVYIYSGQHSAYWRSGRCGYVFEVAGAGVYTLAEAIAATENSGPEKLISFHFVPATDQGALPSVKDYQEESIFDCPSLIFDKYKGVG